MSKRKPVDSAAIKLPLPMLADVLAIYGTVPRIECKGLCQRFCCPVGDTLSEFERARMGKAAGYEPNGIRADRLQERCNMLGDDGRCTIYAARPIICRVWGVADGMPCPHGCKAERVLSDVDAVEKLQDIRRATRGFKA